MLLPCLILAVWAINALCWLALARGFKLSLQSTVPADAERHPVSVIVALRDEVANVDGLVESLRGQTHDPLQIVLVDDQSTDGTSDRLSDVTGEARIDIARTDEPRTGKKNALLAGIDQSRYSILAFTDADCRPEPGWADSLSAYFGDPAEPEVVVGYSPFRREGGLLSAVARYETFVTGFLTAGTIGLGRPYMAVGRNLAYTRRAFKKVDGFSRIRQSLSGDDDLLVQQFAREGISVVHAFGKDTYVETRGAEGWLDWLRRKRRHASAGRYYSKSASVWLGVFHLSGLALYVAPLLSVKVGLGALAAGVAIQWISLRAPAREFGEYALWMAQPVLHLTYATYNTLIAPLGLLFKPRRW